MTLVLDFLSQLKANNNREWFTDNKAMYEAARGEFCEFMDTLIARIARFDPAVKHIKAGDCTYRIYRDLRFSPDKTPYKTHFGGYVNPMGKKSLHCGYYLQVEPGGSFYAAGTYDFSPKMLKAVRQAIYDNTDEYRGIIEEPEFKSLFPRIGIEDMKTTPKGFPKDFEHIGLLKPKDFGVWHWLRDDAFSAPPEEAADRVAHLCRVSKPFLDFLNYTIDDLI